MSELSHWQVSDLIVARIMSQCVDPSGWLLEARRLCELVGLDPARCIPLGGCSLRAVAVSIATEAHKQEGGALERLVASLNV